MGLGTEEGVQKAFLAWLKRQKEPILLDADALNILSLNPKALKDIPEESILTPHPGELKRLIGNWKDDFEKLKAREFVNKWSCILLIKGAHTVVLGREKGYINLSGNPGMATAGSGDVLSGMITGLRATGYAPLQAARSGCIYMEGQGICALGKPGKKPLPPPIFFQVLGWHFGNCPGNYLRNLHRTIRPDRSKMDLRGETDKNGQSQTGQNTPQSPSEPSEKPS